MTAAELIPFTRILLAALNLFCECLFFPLGGYDFIFSFFYQRVNASMRVCTRARPCPHLYHRWLKAPVPAPRLGSRLADSHHNGRTGSQTHGA